jgi:hypothetical protein
MYPCETADLAYQIEQGVLAPYRALGLCPFLSREMMPNGYSETIDGEAVSLLDLWAQVIVAADGLGREARAQ